MGFRTEKKKEDFLASVEPDLLLTTILNRGMQGRSFPSNMQITRSKTWYIHPHYTGVKVPPHEGHLENCHHSLANESKKGH